MSGQAYHPRFQEEHNASYINLAAERELIQTITRHTHQLDIQHLREVNAKKSNGGKEHAWLIYSVFYRAVGSYCVDGHASVRVPVNF